MKIHSKKEIYSISIEQGDPLFKPLGNRSYCRINGKWHHNTGGSQLDWGKMKDVEQIKLIEDVFLETRAKQL